MPVGNRRDLVGLKYAALFVAAMVAFAFGTASALDVEDVRNLLRNQVPEQVIINMIHGDGTIYITPEEADQFRAMGASENLVAELRPRQTVASPAAPAPIVTSSSPVVTSPVVTRVVPAETSANVFMPAEGSAMTPAPIVSSSAYPARFDKEGWLSVSNRDWVPYYIVINRGDKRIFLSRVPNGGVEIPSGANLIFNIRKETYKMYGDSGKSLSVRVRESETTTLSLNPFGVFGNSGLSAVATDRERVRSEILFNDYAPPPSVVVVREPPVIVAPGPRPPSFHFFGDFGGGRGHRRHGRGGGGGFHFGW